MLHHEVNTDAYELALSASRDRWGYRDNLATIGNNPLVNVNTPVHVARQWTITLLAMQFQGGSLQSTFPFLPPNNQVFDTNGMYVALQWGTDGAFEQALVDYPWSGATFDVYGANVRVVMAMTPAALSSLQQQRSFGLPIPNIGAFVSPSVGRYYARGQGSAMYTLPLQGMSSGVIAGGGVFFPVPARARTYQLFGTDGGSPVGNAGFFVRQIGYGYQAGVPGVGNVIQQDQGGNQVFGGTTSGSEPMMGNIAPIQNGLACASNMSQIRALHPATTVINLMPPSDIGANTYNIGCRFGLDLA